MAHVKAGSSKANQGGNVVGKRRGLKVNQGQTVRGGQVLVRQTGIVYKAGLNTKISKDSSVVSRVEGVIKFTYRRRPNGVRTIVNVMPKTAVVVEPKKVAVKAEKTVKVTAPTVKKAAVKAKTVKKVVKKVAVKK